MRHINAGVNSVLSLYLLEPYKNEFSFSWMTSYNNKTEKVIRRVSMGHCFFISSVLTIKKHGSITNKMNKGHSMFRSYTCAIDGDLNNLKFRNCCYLRDALFTKYQHE
jgi:hypothetical protein